MKTCLALLRDEQAATAVEYAVMLALILISVIAGIATVGQNSGGMWGNVDSELTDHGFGQ